MGTGPIGDVGEDLRPVLELDPVDTVGKRLHHDPLHEWGALGHERRVYQRSEPRPLPLTLTLSPEGEREGFQR